MAINFIKKGIDTSDANATASDIAQNKTAYVNGEKVTGILPLFPNSRTFTADGGVTNDTENNRIQIHTINTAKQILDSNLNMEFNGEYADVADAIGLTADKILEGNTILGIEGTAGVGGINTSDADATPDDIVSPKTAYVNGEKLEGTIKLINVQDPNAYYGIGSEPTVIMDDDSITFYDRTPVRQCYEQNSFIGVGMQFSEFNNQVGITSDKIVEGNTILGVEGSAVTDYFVTSVSPDDATIFRYIKRVPMLETANKTDFSSMCSGCTSLIEVPLWDTSSATDMSYMLGGTAITSSPQFNTANATNMENMFKDCTALTTVPVFNTAKVTNMWNMVKNCPALSNDSLNNILAMLTNASAYIEQGTNMTLKWIGLSSTQATTCTTLSNWAACEVAGWTTGY